MSMESIDRLVNETAAPASDAERYKTLSRQVHGFLDRYQDFTSFELTDRMWQHVNYGASQVRTRKTNWVATGIERDGVEIRAQLSARSVYGSRNSWGPSFDRVNIGYSLFDWARDIRIDFALPSLDVISTIACNMYDSDTELEGEPEDVLLALAELEEAFALDKAERERKDEEYRLAHPYIPEPPTVPKRRWLFRK